MKAESLSTKESNMYTRAEINEWTADKSQEVMLRIFQAAKRDLSVNDGTIPDEEVKECESVIQMIEEDIQNDQDRRSGKLFR